MKIRNLQNKKGITLIALAVTIVVSFILLGIVVTLSVGENGLITKANEGAAQSATSDLLEDWKVYTVEKSLKRRIKNNTEGSEEDFVTTRGITVKADPKRANQKYYIYNGTMTNVREGSLATEAEIINKN